MTDNFSIKAGNYTKKTFENDGKDVNKDVNEMSQRVSKELHEADLVMADENIWVDSDGDGKISEGEWNAIFNRMEEKYGVEITDEDQKMLFDILNAGSSDTMLTAEEYEFLMHNDNGITGYSLWHNLAYRDDNYQEEVKANSSEIFKGAIDSSMFDDPNSSASKALGILDKNGELKEQIDAADGKHVKIDVLTYDESELAEIANKIVAELGKGENAAYTLADFENLMSKDDFDALSELVKKGQEDAVAAKELAEAQSEGLNVGALNYNIETILFAENSSYEIDKETTDAFTKAGIEITEENADQVKFAQYLYQEFGLTLDGEDLKAFVDSLPTDKSKMQGFLLEIAQNDGGGTHISIDDLQKYYDYEVHGITSSDVDAITLNLADKEDANAVLLGNLNDTFGTNFTLDNFEIPEGKTLADVVFSEEMLKDGRLTRSELEALQIQQEATE